MKIHLKKAKWGDTFYTKFGALRWFHHRENNKEFVMVDQNGVLTTYKNSGMRVDRSCSFLDLKEKHLMSEQITKYDVSLDGVNGGTRLILADGSVTHYIRKVQNQGTYCHLVRLAGEHDVFSLFNDNGETIDSKQCVAEVWTVDLGFVMPVFKKIEVLTNFVNLNHAKAGEKWETRSGNIVTYRKNVGGHYPHAFDWPNGLDTYHKANGRFTTKCEHDRDVIKRHVV